jgi:hypothetical protein
MNIAFDKSLRSTDVDGRLHVARVNFSKAVVNPYLGSEIDDPSLEPNRVYMMLRDPGELAKAAPTFVNLPLMARHIVTTADEPMKDDIVGSLGSDVEFKDPYLQASLIVWDSAAIAAIESGDVVELSAAYRFTPDMQSGTFNGVKYDGVMRNIVGNHVALVETGRAGPDVMVSDANPFVAQVAEETEMTKRAKAAKLVEDASLAYLDKLLDALTGEEESPADEEEDIAADEESPADVLKEKMKGKFDEDEYKIISDMIDKLGTGPVQDDEPNDEDEEEKAMEEKKTAMDAAVKQAVAEVNALHSARELVAPLVGVVALDSAAAVYKFALDHAGVDTTGVHSSAFRPLVELALKQSKPAVSTMAMDSGAATSVVSRFADISRFKRA